MKEIEKLKIDFVHPTNLEVAEKINELIAAFNELNRTAKKMRFVDEDEESTTE